MKISYSKIYILLEWKKYVYDKNVSYWIQIYFDWMKIYFDIIKKSDIMKIYFIEYKFVLIEWKLILISWKKKLYNILLKQKIKD